MEVAPSRMARALVTNAAFAALVEEGGYQRREWWSSQGWVWRTKAQAQHPLYWQRDGQGWLQQHFETLVPLEPYAPVAYVTWYEAEAYGHGAGRRLPTEAEWDMTASAEPTPDGKGITGRKRRYPWGDEPPTPERANLDTYFLGCADVAAFRLPEGSATFGRSVVDFTRHIQIYTTRAAYGLTDRLSLGVRVPYWTQENQVNATLDNRTATVGFNPAVPGGVAPLGVPGTRPPTTEDIQAFVERLGFRRVETWSDASLSDSFAGAKYQYYRSAHWRLAATGRVRFPTGRWDDPNNLVDFPTGFDAWGLGLELHQDFVWQRPGLAQRLGVLTAGEFFLTTTFHYEAIFPDTKPFRVCSIHQPICPNFDPQVHRDVGDIVEAEIAGTVGLLPGLTLTPRYMYTHKFQDQFRGDRGFNYRQLQAETEGDVHALDLRLAYSTALLFAEKRFPVPLSVSLRYVDRLAGNNNRSQTRYLGFILAGAF